MKTSFLSKVAAPTAARFGSMIDALLPACAILVCALAGVFWSCKADAAVTWNTQTHTAIPGDFNGDGIGDIFLDAKSSASTNYVVLGDQQNAYVNATQFWADSYLSIDWSGQVTAGDFNGDNRTDLLVQAASGGSARILLAGTDGHFNSITQTLTSSVGGVSWSSDTRRVVVGDFNGDGKSDVFLQGYVSTDLSVLLYASASGTFSATAQSWSDGYLGNSWSTATRFAYAGDFNGDGRDDLFFQGRLVPIALPIGSGTVIPMLIGPVGMILNADATGKFTAISAQWDNGYLDIAWDWDHYNVIVGQFDGMYGDDILLQARSGGSSLIAYSDSAGAISSSAVVESSGQMAVDWSVDGHALAAWDFDGDGLDDVLVTASTNANNTIAYSNINGSFYYVNTEDYPKVNGTAFNGVDAGAFTATPNGAASYSVPLNAAPGIGGMTPTLSLNYNSQSGNGLLGMGWSLGGLSAITRCPSTSAQDNLIDPVDFDSNDRYCLDGQRLVAVTNTGCSGGTEYKTEIDGYARVCAYGTGPSYFTVKTKSGLTMSYGNTAGADTRIEAQGSTTVLVWALNQIKDTSSNYLSVSYYENNATGEYYPTRIDYTGNTTKSLSPYHSVRFAYESREDGSTAYVGGSKVTSSVRLANVRMYAGEGIVRDYRLGYDVAPVTGRSRLISLMQCAGTSSSAACMPPTSFAWAAGGSGFAAATSTGRSNTGYQYAQVMDINADGKDDIAYCTAESSYWAILISTGSGLNSAITTSALCTKYQYAVPIDYNTDGKKDLLVPYANGRFYVLKSTGAGFSVVDTGIAESGYLNNPVVSDINGDGRDDLALVYNSAWYLRINNGNGFNAAIATGIASTNSSYRLKIDYDSDGMGDLLVPYANGRWYVFRSTGSGLQVIDTGLSNSGYENSPQVIDMNGDGRQDFVVSYTVTVNGFPTWKNYVYLNKGAGFNAALDTGGGGSFICNGVYQVDYNQDGRADLVAPCLGGYFVYLSNGVGFETVFNELALMNGAYYPRIGDFSGDGMSDLALAYNSVWNLMLHKSGVPDQLTTVTDGAANHTDITYKPLTDSAVYTAADSVYPQMTVRGPLYVVSHIDTSDGIGGTVAKDYTYTNGRVDLKGRGFLGFGTTTVTDAATQIRDLTTYSQTFPYVGLVVADDVRVVGAANPLKTISNAWSYATPFTGIGVYQVRASTNVTTTKDLNGALVSTITTQNSNYDSYGNPGQVIVTSVGLGANGVNETYTKTTTNTYAYNTANWFIGQLTRSTVTSTLPTGTAETRISSFEYSSTTGLLTAEIIEPDDVQLKLRTEYQYDDYGNKKSVTVKDSGTNTYPITAAVSTSVYDYSQLSTNGTYIVTNTNATTTQSETQTIDARFGAVASLTGPNNLTTVWEFDAFGRTTYEGRADGTSTVTDFAWCDSSCAGVDNAMYKVTSQVSGAAETVAYFDTLGRELRSRVTSLDGSAVYKDTQYNNLGQVTKVSRPYFSGTAQTTDYIYDLIGRVTKETAPDGGIVETTYSGLTTSIHRTSENDTYDQTVTRKTNVEGNLIAATDEGNKTTSYTYDAFGNLKTVTDPSGNVTTMGYDKRGRKTSMDDPDMGHWDYKYDALGQLRWQKDNKLQVVTMSYDVLGRMTSRVEPEGTSTWTYDQTGTTGIGKPWTVSGPNGYSETYTYDAVGRPYQTTQVSDGSTFVTTSTYDTYGRLDALTYPNGFQLKHSYNANGYLEKIGNAANSIEVYWTAQEMSPDGQIATELLGNGITIMRTIDAASGRMTSLAAGLNEGSEVQNLYYDYDALGNLKERLDVNLGGLSETFTYDNYNRLTQANIAGVGTKTWTYDSLGNIKSKDGYADYAYGTAGSKPHAVVTARGGSYSYDANGNMQSGGGRSYTWNSVNLPTKITKGNAVVDFSYSPGRARYKQVSTVDGVATTTQYAGGLYEKVTTGTTTTTKNYINAGGRMVAIREQIGTATPTVKYLHQDHLGSTDVITDASGQVLERQSFDAFGTRRVASDWAGSSTPITSTVSTRGYTGHEQVDAVGVIHMNGRVYDPELGRFISADPMVQAPGNGQSLNRYSYVWNNPLAMTDPSGHWGGFIGDWIDDNITQPIGDAIGVDREDFQKYGAPILAIVAAPYAYAYAGILTGSYSAAWTAAGAAAGFTYGGVSTGTVEGALNGALVGASIGSTMYGMGTRALAQYSGFGGLPGAGLSIGIDVADQYVSYKFREVAANYAHNKGLSVTEFNFGLLGLSFAGNALVGTRFQDDGAVIQGILSRQPGGLIDRAKYPFLNKLMGAPFDAIDIVLGYQGLPTATWVDTLNGGAFNHSVIAHSLGTLDASNMAGMGLLSGASLYSLPFGNIAPSNSVLTIGALDGVNFGFLGKIMNPYATVDTDHGGVIGHRLCYYRDSPC